jgi:predicted dehydrogenase
MTNKPIFIEKPIADTPAVHHLTHLIATRPFMVGYNLRFHSCVKKAKEWMNEIGKPLWANITLGQHSEKPPYVRDGVILNWSHEIDLALYLLGPGHVLTSSTRVSNGKDDVSDILLQHNSGCRSLVHLDYVTRPEIRQTLIVGSKATIIIDLVNRMAWLRGSDDVILDQFQGLDTWQMNYVEEMQEFLGLCDGEKSIGCTGKEALAVLDICLEVRKQAGL